MEKLTEYRNVIKQLLTHYAELINRGPHSGGDVEVAFDEVHDHYMLVTIGWVKRHRVRGNIVYVRIRNGKFWIEEDGLEQGIATDLLEAGVPKEDIVLAFQHPSMRPYTEFAVA